MKKRHLFTCLFLALTIQVMIAQVITPANKPNRTQQELIKRGYGMFVHFGINTFSGDEWSDGKVPLNLYNPTDLDCDQWVRIAKESGFRYILLVTKHHDGFCLWDSKYTDYDVASTAVPTDVVGEVAKACRKYGLEFGIYYSLWDRHEPTYRDTDKYTDYMSKQLTELLTNYGSICELWLDGGWDKEVNEWRLPEVYNLVKNFQPNCAVGVNHTIVLKENERQFALPDSMIVDNKYTFQYFPSDFRLWDPKIAHKADKKQYLHKGESYYMPFEHTVCLSKAWNWFQKEGNQLVRELDELEELFYWCTGNNNTLVVNVPPDQRGQLREYEANTIITLGQRLNIKKGKPLPRNGAFISQEVQIAASSVLEGDDAKFGAQYAVDGGMQTRWAAADTLATLTIQLDEKKPFDKITIYEYCDNKVAEDQFSNIRVNRIQAYDIDIRKDNKWLTIYSSNLSMGDCKVIHLPHAYTTSELRLKVTKATDCPSIYELNVIAPKAAK